MLQYFTFKVTFEHLHMTICTTMCRQKTDNIIFKTLENIYYLSYFENKKRNLNIHKKKHFLYLENLDKLFIKRETGHFSLRMWRNKPGWPLVVRLVVAWSGHYYVTIVVRNADSSRAWGKPVSIFFLNKYKIYLKTNLQQMWWFILV